MSVRRESDGDAAAAFAAAMHEEAELTAAWQREFKAFKQNSAARDMMSRLCLSQYLEAATSWRMLRHLVTDLNDNQDRGCVVDIARATDGVCSSGERILLHAILYALDFAWLADKLGGKEVWRNMNRVSGPHLRAAQYCIGAWGS